MEHAIVRDVLKSLVSDVLGKLASTAFQELSRLWGLEADVSALRDTYTFIQAVLADAEVKQRDQKAVEEWLDRLRSASLEMENILDDFLTDAMRKRLQNEWGNVRAFFSNDNPVVVRVRIANQVKTIRRKLDMIAKDISQFNFISNTLSVDVRVGDETTKTRETSSLVHLFKIGRDEEVKTVVERICSKDIIGDDNIKVLVSN